jgi:hypothetical protein
MKPIRLDEWALTMLNETIRADAEFQINQRTAWQEFASTGAIVNGIDVTAGFQHQRSLLMNELTFDFDLVPDRPGFWERVLAVLHLRKSEPGIYYRLKKAGEPALQAIHVHLAVGRDAENAYQSKVSLSPDDSKKPEEIYVADFAR